MQNFVESSHWYNFLKQFLWLPSTLLSQMSGLFGNYGNSGEKSRGKSSSSSRSLLISRANFKKSEEMSRAKARRSAYQICDAVQSLLDRKNTILEIQNIQCSAKQNQILRLIILMNLEANVSHFILFIKLLGGSKLDDYADECRFQYIIDSMHKYFQYFMDTGQLELGEFMQNFKEIDQDILERIFDSILLSSSLKTINKLRNFFNEYPCVLVNYIEYKFSGNKRQNTSRLLISEAINLLYLFDSNNELSQSLASHIEQAIESANSEDFEAIYLHLNELKTSSSISILLIRSYATILKLKTDGKLLKSLLNTQFSNNNSQNHLTRTEDFASGFLSDVKNCINLMKAPDNQAHVDLLMICVGVCGMFERFDALIVRNRLLWLGIEHILTSLLISIEYLNNNIPSRSGDNLTSSYFDALFRLNFLCIVAKIKLISLPDRFQCLHRLEFDKIFENIINFINKVILLTPDFMLKKIFDVIKPNVYLLLKILINSSERNGILDKDHLHNIHQELDSIEGYDIINIFAINIDISIPRSFRMIETKILEFYEYIPEFLSFTLKMRIMNLALGTNHEFAEAQRFLVDRSQILRSSLKQFTKLNILSKPIKVVMINEAGNEEAGEDGGGIFVEYIHLFFKELIDAKSEYFITNRSGQYMPNYKYYNSNSNDSTIFKFVGYLIGQICRFNMITMGKIVLDIKFAPFFFTQLAQNKLISVNHLESFDSELFKGLMELLSYDNLDDLDLYFTTNDSTGNEVELIPGGKDIKVTKSNLNAYFAAWSQYVFENLFSITMNLIRTGMNSVFDNSLIRKFTPKQLQNLICGNDRSSTIDIEDLKLNTVYINSSENDAIIKWFWEIIDTSDSDYHLHIISFVTGMNHSPVLGFEYMNPKFAINVKDNYTQNYLPISQTCFNCLFLPKYDSFMKLKQKLTEAIYSKSGFEMA